MRADLTAEIRKQLQAESKSLEEMNETERANYERDQAIKAKEDLERKLNRSNTEKKCYWNAKRRKHSLKQRIM